MLVATSVAEKKESLQDELIAKCTVALQKALRSGCIETIANALHKYELPGRTANRFKYAIEWAILGDDKVDFWIEVREFYTAIK